VPERGGQEAQRLAAHPALNNSPWEPYTQTRNKGGVSVGSSGCGFRISRLRLQASVFQISDFGSRVSGFGFRVSGFGFRVSGFGHRVEGLESWV